MASATVAGDGAGPAKPIRSWRPDPRGRTAVVTGWSEAACGSPAAATGWLGGGWPGRTGTVLRYSSALRPAGTETSSGATDRGQLTAMNITVENNAVTTTTDS